MPRGKSAPDESSSPDIVFTSKTKNEKLTMLTKLMDRAIRKMDYDQAMVLREQIQKLKHGK